MTSEKSKFNPTNRFSNRVENYIKYRPGYPAEIINFLKLELKLLSSDIIADIGSGTGISSELFLKNGNKVIGIEPNDEMRLAGENLLRKYSDFTSIIGTAEATGLSNHSIDFIVSGQAFHWFNPEKTKTEFKRILKPEGVSILLWNSRKLDSTPFLVAYEDLLNKYATDYKEIYHRNSFQDLNSFFENGYQQKTFENYQLFNYHSLKGRLLSSSYVPLEGDENYEKMLVGLKEIFEEFKTDELVKFEYLTEVYYGKV